MMSSDTRVWDSGVLDTEVWEEQQKSYALFLLFGG